MEVVGRHDELLALDAWLDGEPGEILSIEGAPGIGKTTLWRAAIGKAEERGWKVLRSAGAQTEAQLSFAALRDLLDAVFDDVADELPEPQRHALAVALVREAPAGDPPEPGTIGVALLSTLRLVGRTAPTLVAMDDVQWLDAGSRRHLRYALRRLDGEDVRVLVVARSADARALDLVPADRLRTLKVEELSIGALGRILHTRLGVTYPRPALNRIHQVSGGNPFYALELGRAIDRLPQPLRPGDPLPVPETLLELVRDVMAALPEETLTALGHLSAMSRPSGDHLRAAFGDDESTALTPAIDAGILDRDGSTFRFAHPLYASGVYDLMPPTRRREIHRRLAATAPGEEERVRHLALSADDPDADIAAALEAASSRAPARIVAAEFLEAAARMTPETRPHDRTRRELAAAGALFDVGDATRARTLLEEVLDGDPERKERAEALLLLGRIVAQVGHARDAMRLLRQALEAADDPAALAEIHCSIATLSLFAGTIDGAVEEADRALAAAEGVPDRRWLAEASAARAMAAASSGDPAYRAFLKRALALDTGSEPYGSAWSWTPRAAAADCALQLLDLDAMRAQFGFQLDHGRDSGNTHSEQYGAYGLALTELLAGHPDRAAELGAVALELAETTGVLELPARRLQAEIDAHTGRAEQAEATLSALVGSRRGGMKRSLWNTLAARGALRLAEGKPGAATDDLQAAREISDDLGAGHARALVALVDGVEAAAAAGRAEQAAAALTSLGRITADEPWCKPLRLRAKALLLALRGEVERAAAMLERALELEPPGFFPVQHGRTLLALGAVRRKARSRKAARVALGDALETFERIGAALWAERAREELGRIGGRATGADGLTPAEQRVAELVGEGKSNKEVAATLVVSVHTVEAALTSIYRKLDVRSRTEMAAKLARKT